MFSVVIPLYNKAQSIKSTIQSILDQVVQDFEVIVVNDGSSDDGVSIVEAINDKRIRLINQNNQGVSAARNRGISEAKYDWIAFLDGDDQWRANHLEEVLLMMKLFPHEKVLATSFEYSDNREVFRHNRDKPINKVENYFKDALREKLICTIVVVIHKECFFKVGGFNENLSRGEDLDLWARIAREYPVVKSTAITAVYNIGDPGSLSKGASPYAKSAASLICLKGLQCHERKYFKDMLFRRLKTNIKSMNFKEILLILKKHNFQLFF